MRDAIFAYGPIANATISPTTANTDYYPAGAVGTTYIDMGAMSTLSRFTRHTLDRDLYAVWRAIGAFAAADWIIPFIVDDTVAAMNSSLAYVATYAPTITGIVWPIGQEWIVKCLLKCLYHSVPRFLMPWRLPTMLKRFISPA